MRIAACAAVPGWLAAGLFGGASANVIAGTTAVAAGAILAMLSDTMIPEAFSDAHNMAGLVTVLGFLLAFLLTKLQQ